MGWKSIADTQHPNKEAKYQDDPLFMSLHQTNNQALIVTQYGQFPFSKIGTENDQEIYHKMKENNLGITNFKLI